MTRDTPVRKTPRSASGSQSSVNPEAPRNGGDVAGPPYFPKLAPGDFKPAWVDGLDNDAYHRMTDYVSSTGLNEARRSPRHFFYRFVMGERDEPTAAQELGKLIHTALLEPERFRSTMVLKPKFDRRTTSGKVEADDWDRLNANRIVVDDKQYETLLGVLRSLERRPHLMRMLAAARRETSGFGYDTTTRLQVRVRPDAFIADDGMVIDLKTTMDASPAEFTRAIHNYGYHVQAAVYLDIASQIEGRAIEMFRWVAVEKTPPYEIGIYDADPAWLEIGRADLRTALDRVAHGIETSEWPGYQTEMSGFISPPDWLFARYKVML